MNTQSEKIVSKILYWLFLEVVFNLIGIDELVDYSEFTLMPKVMIQIIPIAKIITTDGSPSQSSVATIKQNSINCLLITA